MADETHAPGQDAMATVGVPYPEYERLLAAERENETLTARVARLHDGLNEIRVEAQAVEEERQSLRRQIRMQDASKALAEAVDGFFRAYSAYANTERICG